MNSGLTIHYFALFALKVALLHIKEIVSLTLKYDGNKPSQRQ